jgi:hypothetical protein
MTNKEIDEKILYYEAEISKLKILKYSKDIENFIKNSLFSYKDCFINCYKLYMLFCSTTGILIPKDSFYDIIKSLGYIMKQKLNNGICFFGITDINPDDIKKENNDILSRLEAFIDKYFYIFPNTSISTKDFTDTYNVYNKDFPLSKNKLIKYMQLLDYKRSFVNDTMSYIGLSIEKPDNFDGIDVIGGKKEPKESIIAPGEENREDIEIEEQNYEF